jgi:ribose-phosphate pyrophosphokinase
MSEPAIILRGQPIGVGTYPAGEPLLHHAPTDDGWPNTMVLRPTGVLDLMAGLWLADALAERGDPVETLVIPYLPGGRQDRLMDGDGDALFTAKSIAREINLRDFGTVITFDPHSDVMPALIDRCKVHGPRAVLGDGRSHWDTIIAPDAGATKRAHAVARAMRARLVQGWKHRDTDTGAITDFGIESDATNLGRCLVVDDICDGGGTFVGLAQAVQARYPGTTLDLYVSHGFFSKGLDHLWPHYNRILTTNSTLAACGTRDLQPMPALLDALVALT